MHYPTPKPKQCEGIIVESGRVSRRWIDSIELHIPGHRPRTLEGNRLPNIVILNTGDSQQATTVLEFFYEDTRRIKPLHYTHIYQERTSGISGRDAITAAVAVITFQVLIALMDAVARALN